MNSTRAVEVSIQAVSPELIFDESTENGSVGAAGADAAVAALAVSGALAGAAAVVSEAAADAAAGADASCAITVPALTPSSDPAINKELNNIGILLFPRVAMSFIRERPRRSHRCECE